MYIVSNTETLKSINTLTENFSGAVKNNTDSNSTRQKYFAAGKILLLKIKLATTLNLFIVNLMKIAVTMVTILSLKLQLLFVCLSSIKIASSFKFQKNTK